MKRINLFLSFVLTLVLMGCGGRNLVLGELEVSETPNPSVYILNFSLKDTVSVSVRLTNLDNGKVFYDNTLLEKTEQKVLLPGLKSGNTYKVELLLNNQLVSRPYTFKTRPIQKSLFEIEKKIITPNVFDGYVLTQRKGTSDGYLYMLDADGDVVWYQRTSGIPKLSHWTNNKNIITLLGNNKHNNSAGSRILAQSLDGSVSYDLDLTKINRVAHHEVLERSDGLYTLVYDTIPYSYRGKMEKAVSSAVLCLDKKGKILWKWSTFDVVKPNGVPPEELKEDWGHANALAFDSDGNLLISYRDWNQIWKIDRKTGSRIWILGEGGDFELEGPPFEAQHAILKDAYGSYMLFDNGPVRGQTRIVSYKLTENSASLTRDLALPKELFSVKMGNALELPDLNILVCASGSESIAVLDSAGKILYHVATGIPSPYRATYVPTFYTHSN